MDRCSSGREAGLDSLRLTEGTVIALREWNVRATPEFLDALEAAAANVCGARLPDLDRLVEALAAESGSLAGHVRHELGHGAHVQLWLDSPDM